MKRFLLPLLCLYCLAAHAQLPASSSKDAVLDTVVVKAFSSLSQWKATPAAIAVIGQPLLHRFDQVSLVPVLNTVAGVRMEERSPGSYRLSIRGSLLRSPFGIRNIKVYWDDIPLTDAGGNTYLQLVDIHQLQSMEIIKGPAASMYGANTGGAVLLHSLADSAEHGLSGKAAVGGGSYGLFNEQAGINYQSSTLQLQVKQNHMQSDGYRQQSAMRRDGGQVNGRWQLNRYQALSFLGFYTDLHYETPGGITLQQMQQNPKLARQPGNGLPGSVAQQAAVFNKTGLLGLSLNTVFNSHWSNTTTLTANHTGFKNPFITNYEKRNEWNYGGRTSFRYQWNSAGVQWQALAGGEWQQNRAHVDDYGNRGGVQDTVQFKDVLRATQAFLFAQLQAVINGRWYLQAGLSRNTLGYSFRRPSDPAQASTQQTHTGALWAPRFSVLYQLAPGLGVYAVAAKGFSPPSTAEVRPSDGNYYGNLQPEYGWNYEGGIKGAAFASRLQYDASFYYFRLTHAIVRRVNEAGAEYFVNAGGTSQKGVELWVKGWLLRNDRRFVSSLSLFNSFSYQPYRFDTYVSGNADYSGNRITGVPRSINISGLDLVTRPGWYATVTFNATSSIPLTDANDVYAAPYHLLQGRLGYRHTAGKLQFDVYAGADNLLNEVYSLGNDINAMGKRYYNPAPARNFFAGLILEWK
jgi:iron complex outermembrane receptor protein